MKFMITVFMFLSLASAAQASKVDPLLLPEVSDVKVSVIGGDNLAAVQPYVLIGFKYSSCVPVDFSFEREEKVNKKGVVVVFVKFFKRNLEAKCFGNLITKEYSLQVSSDSTSESYVVLNPIRTTRVR